MTSRARTRPRGGVSSTTSAPRCASPAPRTEDVQRQLEDAKHENRIMKRELASLRAINEVVLDCESCSDKAEEIALANAKGRRAA